MEKDERENKDNMATDSKKTEVQQSLDHWLDCYADVIWLVGEQKLTDKPMSG